jgi:hypothetical protein
MDKRPHSAQLACCGVKEQDRAASRLEALLLKD